MNKLSSAFSFLYNSIENIYTWLMGVFYEELFHGQRNPEHSKVLLAFVLFCFMSVFYYFFDDMLDHISIYFGIIIFIHQIAVSLKSGQSLLPIESEQTSIHSYFHEFKILLFLLIMSNFLPRAGHFILVFGGPYFGYYCDEMLSIDLSLNGIFSMFYIEPVVSDYIQVFILSISFFWAIRSKFKTSG